MADDADAGAPAAASDINTPSESVPGETDLLIEFVINLRQSKFQTALNICRQVLGINDKLAQMQTYDDTLVRLLKQEEESKQHEHMHSPKLEPAGELSSNNRAHINEILTELLAELKTHLHDTVGSTHRRQSVLPFEEFQYPDYDPHDQESYGSDVEEEEDGDEKES